MILCVSRLMNLMGMRNGAQSCRQGPHECMALIAAVQVPVALQFLARRLKTNFVLAHHAFVEASSNQLCINI